MSDDAAKYAQTPPAPGEFSDWPTGLKTVMRVELSDGTWVCVEASGPLTATTAEEVMEYWMVYERVLRKRASAEMPSVGMSKEPADLLRMADQKVHRAEEEK